MPALLLFERGAVLHKLRIAPDRGEGRFQVMGDIGYPFLPHGIGLLPQPVTGTDFPIQGVQAVIEITKGAPAFYRQVAAGCNFLHGDGQPLHTMGGKDTISKPRKQHNEKKHAGSSQDNRFSAGEPQPVQIHGGFGNFHGKMEEITIVPAVFRYRSGETAALPLPYPSFSGKQQQIRGRIDVRRLLRLPEAVKLPAGFVQDLQPDAFFLQ